MSGIGNNFSKGNPQCYLKPTRNVGGNRLSPGQRSSVESTLNPSDNSTLRNPRGSRLHVPDSSLRQCNQQDVYDRGMHLSNQGRLNELSRFQEAVQKFTNFKPF